MNTQQPLPCFKALDIRGRIPDQLNSDIAFRIGQAYAVQQNPRKVVVGSDIRLSSPEIKQALVDGLIRQGVDVIDIGTCGTEMIYFGAFALEHEGVDGGIMVTASHNPADYNGMKLVSRGAIPISADSGLQEIERATREQSFTASAQPGNIEHRDLMQPYIEHLLSYVRPSELAELSIVCNAGNGGAGLVIDAIESALPFHWHKVHHNPDGSFPNGVPNPLLKENRLSTSTAVVENGAHLGIAWDGDFDRCFFFDEKGAFIEGYYMVGLFAVEMLRQHPGETILYDPRLTWNTVHMVKEVQGHAICCKTGHAFIKERMRRENAVYGGEMSAHHYFRDFAFCDSGMIPWLLCAELLSRLNRPLSALIEARQRAFPASGEINLRLEDPNAAFAHIEKLYQDDAAHREDIDGLSLAFSDWRFNLRKSNTEPVVRLNVESRGNEGLMHEKTEEILGHLRAWSAS